MIKIALAVAASTAVLMAVPSVAPAKVDGVKLAQGVDVEVGRDRGYRDYDRDYRYRHDRDTTVGIGPGGVRIGPRHNCRTESVTVEREGRMITRRERRCD